MSVTVAVPTTAGAAGDPTLDGYILKAPAGFALNKSASNQADQSTQNEIQQLVEGTGVSASLATRHYERQGSNPGLLVITIVGFGGDIASGGVSATIAQFMPALSQGACPSTNPVAQITTFPTIPGSHLFVCKPFQGVNESTVLFEKSDYVVLINQANFSRRALLSLSTQQYAALPSSGVSG